MGDEETPADAPPAEETAPAETQEAAAPAPAGDTVDSLKALSPDEVWAKHPALKEAYDALEDKEGIIDQAEAAEGEDPPPPAWGEKAGDFLEGHKDKFAAAAEGGESAPPAEPEKPKEPLKKVIKELTLEDVAAAVGEPAAVQEKWAAAEKLAGGSKALDKLSKEACNNMLDCASPTDVMSLGMTCRDLYTKYGKPRMRKEHMRWMAIRGTYNWERGVGGPLWDFPEGQTTELDKPADELVGEQFVAQSKKGEVALKHGVAIPTAKRVHQHTYEAIVSRALGNRLRARGLNSFEIALTDYQEDGNSTFTVTHNVLDGTAQEVLDRAIAAIHLQMELKSLSADLKEAKNLVASAIVGSQSIQERAAALKESCKELGEKGVDASEPIQQLRSAAKEPMEKIRQTLKALDEAASDEVFAEKVAGGPGEGRQKDFRVNLASRLRQWIEFQQGAIAKAVEGVNGDLLDKSMNEQDCKSDTADIKVKAVAQEDKHAPEFLSLEDAIRVLDILFKKELEKSLGDSAVVTNTPGDDSVKWTVELQMDM